MCVRAEGQHRLRRGAHWSQMGEGCEGMLKDKTVWRRKVRIEQTEGLQEKQKMRNWASQWTDSSNGETEEERKIFQNESKERLGEKKNPSICMRELLSVRIHERNTFPPVQIYVNNEVIGENKFVAKIVLPLTELYSSICFYSPIAGNESRASQIHGKMLLLKNRSWWITLSYGDRHVEITWLAGSHDRALSH